MSKSYNIPAHFLSAPLLRSCVVVIGIALAQPASAQLFFDWGGQEKVNDSGSMSVRIDAPNKPGEIIVSFSDRKLYFITAPGMAMSYPIAIPREQDRWQGQTSVTQKRENPSWTPTPSMIKENPKLPRWVPGGHPLNPLGNRALYLGSSMYRIHGTDAPWTIGTAVSKGCIRMYNKDALDIYERAKIGAKVIVTWNTYKFTPLEGQANIAQSNVGQSNAAQSGVGQSKPSDTQTSNIGNGAPAATAAGAAASSQPTSRPTRNSNVGRIYDSGGVEDFSTRRSRRQVEAEPDFASPPQPSTPASTASATDRPVRSQTSGQQPQAQDQTRGDRANRQRNTTEQGTNSGSSRRTTTRTPPAQPTAASDIETSAIDRDVATTPVAAAEPVAAPETPRPAVRSAPARQPAQVQPAQVQPNQVQPTKAQTTPPAPAVAATTSSDDLATRALHAAERAAAAAERAAAAAERAERASRAVSQAPAAAPSPSAD